MWSAAADIHLLQNKARDGTLQHNSRFHALCPSKRHFKEARSLVHPWSEHTSLTPGVHALSSSLGSVSLYYTIFLFVCSVTFCLNTAKTQNRDRLNSTHFNVIGIGTDAEIQFSPCQGPPYEIIACMRFEMLKQGENS